MIRALLPLAGAILGGTLGILWMRLIQPDETTYLNYLVPTVLALICADGFRLRSRSEPPRGRDGGR